MTSVEFRITCSDTKPGQAVFVVGSAEPLGSWKCEKSLKLATSAQIFPCWHGVARLPAGAVEYKVVIAAESGDASSARWESGANRKLNLGLRDVTATVKLTWGRPGESLEVASASPSVAAEEHVAHVQRATPSPPAPPQPTAALLALANMKLSSAFSTTPAASLPKHKSPMPPRVPLVNAGSPKLANGTSPKSPASPIAGGLLPAAQAFSPISSTSSPPLQFVPAAALPPRPRPLPAAPASFSAEEEAEGPASAKVLGMSIGSPVPLNVAAPAPGSAYSSPRALHSPRAPSSSSSSCGSASGPNTPTKPARPGPQAIPRPTAHRPPVAPPPHMAAHLTIELPTPPQTQAPPQASPGPLTSPAGAGSPSALARLAAMPFSPGSLPSAVRVDFGVPKVDGEEARGLELGQVLGRSSLGAIHQCTEMATDTRLALARIPRHIVYRAPHRLRVIVEVMRRLLVVPGDAARAGHPNVVAVRDLFETPLALCYTMELVTGGKLFDRMVMNGTYSEKDAADCMRRVAAGMAHLHRLGVCHSDIKPENLMYTGPDADSELVLVGLDRAHLAGDADPEAVERVSPEYLAPEVAALGEAYRYEPAADVWSFGVILYVLLCGYFPFFGKTPAEVHRRARDEPVDLTRREWASVSEGAKRLLRRALEKDPRKRATTAELLEDPWLRGEGCAEAALGPKVVSNLAAFTARRRFKASVLAALALGRFKSGGGGAGSPASSPRGSPVPAAMAHGGHLAAGEGGRASPTTVAQMKDPRLITVLANPNVHSALRDPDLAARQSAAGEAMACGAPERAFHASPMARLQVA